MAEVEEPGKLDRAKEIYGRISEKFKLGPHYTMERMSIVVGSFAVVGLLLTGTSVWQASQADRVDIAGVASYTGEFEASRTGQIGEVTGVYGDGIGTRAMVMMKFAKPSEMSSDAEDYTVHITGIEGDARSGKPAKVAQPTAGEIFAFPGNGYLGIMLDAPDGFSEQLLNLTVRAKKELSDAKPMPEEDRISQGLDSSFAEHDQWRVVINPVADTVVAAQALATPQPEIRDIYAEMVVREEEKAKRVELDGHLAEMKTQYDRMVSFEDAMSRTSVRVNADEGVRMVPPRLPDELAGDEIVGMSSAEVGKALQSNEPEDIPDLAKKTELARLLDTQEGFMPNTYDLLSDATVVGGIDYDWRSSTIEEGYLDWVIPAGVSPIDYLMGKAVEPVPELALREESWMLTNGMDMSELSGSDPAVKPLLDIRNNAMQAYNSYFSLKVEYQRNLLPSLLFMENDLDTIVANATTASGPDAVTFKL